MVEAGIGSRSEVAKLLQEAGELLAILQPQAELRKDSDDSAIRVPNSEIQNNSEAPISPTEHT